jgi:hypothetical protein
LQRKILLHQNFYWTFLTLGINVALILQRLIVDFIHFLMVYNINSNYLFSFIYYYHFNEIMGFMILSWNYFSNFVDLGSCWQCFIIDEFY